MAAPFVKKTIKVLEFSFVAIILALSSSFLPLTRMLVSASGSVNPVVGSGITAFNGVTKPIIDVSVSGSGATVVNVTVSSGTLTLDSSASGVTYATSSSGDNITMSGDVADINAALAAMTYTASTNGSYMLYVSVLPGTQPFDAPTKHMYQKWATLKQWDVAVNNPGGNTLYGALGYLATITSPTEEEAAYAAANGDTPVWLGGNDEDTTGTWKWTTGSGPEVGQTIGANGGYTNWDTNAGAPTDNGTPPTCVALTNGVDDGDGNIDAGWKTFPCNSTSNKYKSIFEFDVSSQVTQSTEAITVTNAPVVTHTVATCDQLQQIGDDPSTIHDVFKLTADIDCQGSSFTPLNWGGDPFGGTLDGQGHSISNLSVDVGGNAGLFDYLSGATVRNLTLASGSVRAEGSGGSDYAGALVGEADDSTITNVISHVDVSSADDEAGGLVGDVEAYTTGTTISGSGSTGSVSGSNCVGGLIGYAGNGDTAPLTIEHSYATGDVSNNDSYTGGLIGELEAYDEAAEPHLLVQDVYAQGGVNAPDEEDVGGLIGGIYGYDDNGDGVDITIRRAYASGAVTGDGEVSGFIGETDGDDTVAITLANVFTVSSVNITAGDPYNDGFVIGNDNVSGGTQSSGVYYDSYASTIAGVYGVHTGGNSDLTDTHDVDPDGTHLAYFQNNHSVAPLTAWDFTNIWVANSDNYPTFAPANIDDDDGVTAVTENGAPQGGDGNNDGTLDSAQANVTSLVDTQDGHYVTVAAPDACDLSAVTTTAETANAAQDADYNYPAGMVNYTAGCGSNGYIATMNLYFYGVSKTGLVLRKYNPTTHVYADVPNATLTDVTIGGQAAVLATYDITDGGPLDADGAANGSIVDPVGLAVSPSGAAATTSSGTSGSLTNTGIAIGVISLGSTFLVLFALIVKKWQRITSV